MRLAAYNLNCWLLLMQRAEEETVETLKHTTMATVRFRSLFIAAPCWAVQFDAIGVWLFDVHKDARGASGCCLIVESLVVGSVLWVNY